MEDFKDLVVEDDATARKQLSRAIGKEGYQVFTAEDGRAGIEQFKKERPEIVVTDLKMPGVDGVEVMHTIRRLSNTTQVIVVTAFGETDTAISALREGALDYLKKAERYNRQLKNLDYHLGMAYGQLNQLGEAHYYFGLYHLRRGSVKNATFHFQEALRRSDDLARREAIRKRLAKINKEMAAKVEKEAEKGDRR